MIISRNGRQADTENIMQLIKLHINIRYVYCECTRLMTIARHTFIKILSYKFISMGEVLLRVKFSFFARGTHLVPMKF